MKPEEGKSALYLFQLGTLIGFIGVGSCKMAREQPGGNRWAENQGRRNRS